MPIFNQDKKLLRLLQPPVLIIGMHRSGTTLLAQLLDSAGIFMGNDFTAHFESNYFQKLNNELLEAEDGSWDEPIATTNSPQLKVRYFVTEYLSFFTEPHRLFALSLQSKWGWKDPRNTFTIASWLKIFPHLKVVHIIRNGIDVSISLFERNLALQEEDKWYSTGLITPEACFDLWERYVNEAQKWETPLGHNYLELRYEGLVNQDKETISKLENFAGIKLNEKHLKIINRDGGNKSHNPSYLGLRNYALENGTFKKLNYATG